MPNRLLQFTLAALIVREKGSKEETFGVGWDSDHDGYRSPESALIALLDLVNDEFGTRYRLQDLDNIDPDWN